MVISAKILVMTLNTNIVSLTCFMQPKRHILVTFPAPVPEVVIPNPVTYTLASAVSKVIHACTVCLSIYCFCFSLSFSLSLSFFLS